MGSMDAELAYSAGGFDKELSSGAEWRVSVQILNV